MPDRIYLFEVLKVKFFFEKNERATGEERASEGRIKSTPQPDNGVDFIRVVGRFLRLTTKYLRRLTTTGGRYNISRQRQDKTDFKVN